MCHLWRKDRMQDQQSRISSYYSRRKQETNVYRYHFRYYQSLIKNSNISISYIFKLRKIVKSNKHSHFESNTYEWKFIELIINWFKVCKFDQATNNDRPALTKWWNFHLHPVHSSNDVHTSLDRSPPCGWWRTHAS